MGETEKEKIKRFANDEVMNKAIKDVILHVFNKGKPNEDVHMKAARFLSIGLLEEAWREIYAFKEERNKDNETGSNIGL